MGGVSLTVHPLFFIFGFYYAFVGRFFEFAVYTITAVVHELGHSFAAAKSGCRLNKITLMPFGAVVKGDIDGLKLSDQTKIALAGPITNLAIGLSFVALWWIFPETYAFTDIAAEANLSMAAINCLPIFPLDGGRVLGSTLTRALGKKRASAACSVVSIIFCLVLTGAFIYSAFNELNLSLLFFCLFVFFGTFGKAKENKYVRLYSSFSPTRLKNGLEVKRVAIDRSVIVKKVIGLLDENRLNEIDVYDGAKKIATLSCERTISLVEKGDLYSPIGEYLS